MVDKKLADDLDSPAQKIRVSESWTEKNIFCPNCGHFKINKHISNNKIKHVLVEPNKGHLTFSKLSKETWGKIIMWLSTK